MSGKIALSFFFQPSDLNSELSYLKSAKERRGDKKDFFMVYPIYTQFVSFIIMFNVHKVSGVQTTFG